MEQNVIKAQFSAAGVQANEETMEKGKKHDDKCRCGGEETREIVFASCEDKKCRNIGRFEVGNNQKGKILRLSLTLKDVCPSKRTAVAVTLYELDARGKKHERGLRILTVPASGKPYPSDIEVTGICFILPDDISTGTNGNRRFTAEVISEYIDVITRDCQSKCCTRTDK